MALHYHLPSPSLHYRHDHPHPPHYPSHSHQYLLPLPQPPYHFPVPIPYLEVRYPYPMLPDIYIPHAYPPTFWFPYGPMRSYHGTEDHIIIHQHLILNDDESDIFDGNFDIFNNSAIEAEQGNQEQGLEGGEETSYSEIGNLKRIVQDGTRKYEEKECSICLDKLLACEDFREELGRMPCEHVFHYGCIAEWLRHSRVCPLCRGPVD